MNYKLTTSFIISALALGASYSVMADTTTDVQSQNTQSALTTSMNTNTDVQSETAQDTQSKDTTANDNSYNQILRQMPTQVQSVQADSTTTADDQNKLLCPAPAQNTDSIATYVNEYNQKVADGWNYNKDTNQWPGSTYNPTAWEENQPITPKDPRFQAYNKDRSGSNWSVIKNYLTVDSSQSVGQTWYKATPCDCANYQVNVYDAYGNFLYTHKYNSRYNEILDSYEPTINDKNQVFKIFLEQPGVDKHLSYTQSYVENGWYQFDGYANVNDQFISHLVKSYFFTTHGNRLVLNYSENWHHKDLDINNNQSNTNSSHTITMGSGLDSVNVSNGSDFDTNTNTNHSLSGDSELKPVKVSGSDLDAISIQDVNTDGNKPSLKELSKVYMPDTTDINKGNHHANRDNSLFTTSANRLPQTGGDLDNNDVIVIGMYLLAVVLIIIFGF